MAHFYGTLQGARGVATKIGSRKSGITASAQSYEGSVTVSLETDNVTETNLVEIRVRDGSGVGGRVAWRGPLVDLLTADKLVPLNREIAARQARDAFDSVPA